jgi:hypothetical protein
LKRQVDWLVNGSLTGPIFSRALNQLTQLEIFPARDKDWPVNDGEDRCETITEGRSSFSTLLIHYRARIPKKESAPDSLSQGRPQAALPQNCSATLDPHLELVNGTAEVKSGTNGLSESGPLARMGIIGSVGLHIMSMHVWGYPRTSRSAEARNS